MNPELKSQVDKVWNAFWSGGIANPMEVIEQITYLLFIKRLDDLQLLAERKANTTGRPIENSVFPDGTDDSGRRPRPYSDLRWSNFKNFSAQEMYDVLDQNVFPFIRGLGAAGSSFATNMKDARFTIPTAALLSKVVDLLEDIPMDDRDTKGDVYEYMLNKLATAGQNGQFRTTRPLIKLIVEMMAPGPNDRIVDPAAGTAGFLVAAASYLYEHHGSEIHADSISRSRFSRDTFTGFDSDNSMSRIGSMNMLLHGVDAATMERRDSLAEDYAGETGYSMVLANPPFAGSVDHESIAKDLLAVVSTRKTELLFIALILRLLRNGGRAAVIVPEGVLVGASAANVKLRRTLIDKNGLIAVVKLPSGAFKPYTGVSTAILFFQKAGTTRDVWFYDVRADGMTLDDKRLPTTANDLPDVLDRWRSLSQTDSREHERSREDQSFLVPRDEIAQNGYDLSFARYRRVAHTGQTHRSVADLMAELEGFEREIAADLNALSEAVKEGSST